MKKQHIKAMEKWCFDKDSKQNLVHLPCGHAFRRKMTNAAKDSKFSHLKFEWKEIEESLEKSRSATDCSYFLGFFF